MTRDEMIEVMALAIEAESNLRRYGLYDYTGYPSSYAPHVVRNEADRSVILRSYSAEEASDHYEHLNRSRLALAALSALEAAGYVVVPKEPTPEMLDAFIEDAVKCDGFCDGLVIDNPRVGYAAMLSAAQQEKTDAG